MGLKGKRRIFYTIWLLVLFSGPLTVFLNTPYSLIVTDEIILINTFQRITGLLAFSLIFIQILLGAYMDRWVQIIGAKAYRFHVVQGLMTYSVIFIHPLLNSALTYAVSKNLGDVILGFVPAFSSQREIFLSYGKIAFVLVTISVFAAYFRTKPFFRRNWKAFHILNYLVFILVAFHSKGVGTDVSTFPFNFLYWVFVSGIAFIILHKLYLKYLKTLSVSHEAS
mgnify:CR=1 FL=1